MQIGQLSKATGVPVRTIRFYEDKGILPAARRTASQYRDYDDDAVGSLRFLRAAQDAGLTLSEIATILAIRAQGEAPCVHTRELLRARRAEIAVKLRELRDLEREIGRLMDEGSDIDGERCAADSICSIIPSSGRPTAGSGTD